MSQRAKAVSAKEVAGKGEFFGGGGMGGLISACEDSAGLAG